MPATLPPTTSRQMAVISSRIPSARFPNPALHSSFRLVMHFTFCRGFVSKLVDDRVENMRRQQMAGTNPRPTTPRNNEEKLCTTARARFGGPRILLGVYANRWERK